MRYTKQSAVANPMVYPSLEYGDLEALHPTESYSEIKTRRVNNYNVLKALTQLNEEIYIIGRLEVFVGTSPIQSSVKLTGVDKETSQIILYPFTPDISNHRILISPRYGDTHTLQDITIKAPVKNRSYETYDCTIRPSGAANTIEITDSVRSEFWSEMVPGKTIFINWTFGTVGQAKVIDSVDEENNLIILTTNITGPSDDTAGKFGTTFKEEISVQDYLDYGGTWFQNSSNYHYTAAIYGVPAAGSGADYILNLTNVAFENCFENVLISMGNYKVNIFGECDFKGAAVNLSCFARSVANGQQVTIDADATLLIEGAGDLLDGALLAQPSGNYGAGGYIHDSIIVKSYGVLHLKNNTSASWRQYSSSYGPNTGGAFSYYANIIEQGSQEYGMLCSNTMPTVIDNMNFTGNLLVRHDTTINGGQARQVFAQNTDFGIGSRTIEINDFTFLGAFAGTAGHHIYLLLYASATLNNCIYQLPTFASCQVMINPAPTTIINGGEIMNGGSVGDYIGGSPSGNEGSRFIYAALCPNLTIDGIVVPALNFYFLTTSTPQTPYLEKDNNIVINNVGVNCRGFCIDGLSTAGTVSKTISGTNIVIKSEFTQNTKGWVQNIAGLQGRTTKVLSAGALAIDFLNDEYDTNGTLSVILGASRIYGRNIRIHATGGDLTINTFDVSLRPTSNIIGANGTVIAEGNFVDLVINREYVFMTGSTNTQQQIGTGNGATKIYKGVLNQTLLDPNEIINVTAGSIDVNCDSNGIINDPNVVGIVDYFTGKYELRFTENVPDTVPIIVDFNYPNEWKNTGSWTIT